jgi:transcriptional regulator with XRE-family HTH domain
MVPVTKSFIELFQHLRITKAQFVRDLGIAKQTLENILLEKNLPGIKVIYRVLDVYPWVNPSWLLTNEGPMKKAEAKDYERLEKMLEEKDKAIRDLRMLAETQKKAIELLEKLHKQSL